jgi:pseudo-rSAM protein
VKRLEYEQNKGGGITYWLFLHPYVYVSVKKDRAILYNTLNNRLLEYGNGTSVFKLIKRLNSDTNLYVIKIESGEINIEIREFIDQLRGLYFGDVIDTGISTRKPIQLKPVLNLQKTLDYLTVYNEKTRILVEDEIPDYLNIITLYINNGCNQACSICRDAYKQFLCCHKGRGAKKEIDIEDIIKLVNQVKKSSLHKFNIIGGNLFSYLKLYDLVKQLNSIRVIKEYFFHYLNIDDHSTFFKLLQDGNNRLNVIVHFPVEPDIFNYKIEVLLQSQFAGKLYLQFVIQREKDIETAESILSKFQVDKFQFVPYFNGNNIDFFQDYVFLDRESILESQPEMNDILMRTALNTFDFKKLIVLSDKSTYANLNNPKIGTLGNDHIMELIYKELHKGKSWTKVRKHIKPCKSCAFNALCPPISNYEYAIGRYNLCHIW